jgi:hypothetical protein
MTFLRIFGRRIWLNETGVEAIKESAALQDNSRRNVCGAAKCAPTRLLPRSAGLWRIDPDSIHRLAWRKCDFQLQIKTEIWVQTDNHRGFQRPPWRVLFGWMSNYRSGHPEEVRAQNSPGSNLLLQHIVKYNFPPRTWAYRSTSSSRGYDMENMSIFQPGFNQTRPKTRPITMDDVRSKYHNSLGVFFEMVEKVRWLAVGLNGTAVIWGERSGCFEVNRFVPWLPYSRLLIYCLNFHILRLIDDPISRIQ